MELNPAVNVQCKLQHEEKKNEEEKETPLFYLYLKFLPSSKKHISVSYLSYYHMLAISTLCKSHPGKPKANFL